MSFFSQSSIPLYNFNLKTADKTTSKEEEARENSAKINESTFVSYHLLVQLPNHGEASESPKSPQRMEECITIEEHERYHRPPSSRVCFQTWLIWIQTHRKILHVNITGR